ncbi:hypothetical protein FQN54_005589 [Arachnomyces sp. PD_36]|nr:hypothetical protein FQN54_005589 [Arachnomyces sp. PD_36]
MGAIKCEPFTDAQEFSDLMPSLFKLYGCHGYATYPFSFMQPTLDLNFVCKDATAEKVVFSTPTGLENALQNSELINSPENNRTVISAPRDDSWAGWTSMAIGGLVTDVGLPRGESLFDGPLLGVLSFGLYADSYRRVLGYHLYRHKPQHWALMIRDHTPLDSAKRNAKDYLLQSEILGITAIFYEQMNEIDWDPSERKYSPAKLTYQDGLLTATIVTFLIGKVRVVQASCDPSQEYPELNIALRGVHDLKMSCYNKAVFHEIIKWILCPPDPPRELPLRSRKA